MPASRLEDFQRSLRETGGYRTAAALRRGERSKPSAWATLMFSLNVARVFPLCAIYEPLGRLTTHRWAEFCFSSISYPESLGMKVTFEGFEHRAAYKGPVMYLCNHMATLETIMLPPALLTFGPFNFVAKQSLAHLPFLTAAADHMGMIGIGRKSPREDLMKMLTVGRERIAQGNSFLIFPQGTRDTVFRRAKFSSIGAKLAEKAGCPIVPIVVDTSCQPRRDRGLLKHLFRDFGPLNTERDIRCCAGPVIPCGKAKVMHEASFEWMAGKLEEWQLDVER